MAHNTRAVRELLMAAFDDEEFVTFCFDHARPVQQQFTNGQQQSARIQMLIDYAVRQGTLDAILGAVEQANPYQYSAYKIQLTAKSEPIHDDVPLLVRPLPQPPQKYDHFFEQWVRELARLDMSPQNYARSVIAGLTSALQADLGFVLVNQGVTWEPTIALDDRAARDARQLTGNSRIREMLNQATQHRKSTYVDSVQDIDPCLFAPLIGTKAPSLLVFTGLRGALALDSTIGIVLEVILTTTKNLTLQVGPETLELNVYDALRRMGTVSEAMYNRQFELYSRRLERMTVFFEPIIYLHPMQPYIWGWEALARDPETARAPIDLFKIAERWGTRFQLELDMHFLKAAVRAYVYDIEKEASRRRTSNNGGSAHTSTGHTPVRARKEELQPLTVNVYPASLVRTRYYEVLRALYLDGQMPLNKLTIEISEKSALPMPDEKAESNEQVRRVLQGTPAVHLPIAEDGTETHEQYEWFLGYLRRLEQFDVRFAIDDFGVGHASPERLSRLGVSVVKIDRNALLYRHGDFTIGQVTAFARSIPGYMQVIVEGFDDDSLFPLRKLFDAHIRYVQGHRLGVARPDVNRLTKEDVDHIRAALQAPASSKQGHI